MANHCYNFIVITGSKDNVSKLKETLYPVLEKEGLWHNTYPKSLGIDVPEGYDYSSKWCDFYIDDDDDTKIVLSGDSAWGPALGYFVLLSKTFHVKVEIKYEESGMDFGGVFIVKDGDVITDDSDTYWRHRYKDDSYGVIEALAETMLCDYKSFNEFAEMHKDLLEIMTDDDKQELIDLFK
jgi:hypothetical protein